MLFNRKAYENSVARGGAAEFFTVSRAGIYIFTYFSGTEKIFLVYYLRKM